MTTVVQPRAPTTVPATHSSGPWPARARSNALDEQPVQPGRAEQLDPLVGAGHQRRGDVGAEHVQRVGLEGDGEGPGAALAGEVGHLAEDGGVPTVDAVEVADGDDGGTVPGRDVAQRSPHVHGDRVPGGRRPVPCAG